MIAWRSKYACRLFADSLDNSELLASELRI